MFLREEENKYRFIKRKGIKDTDELFDFMEELDDDDRLIACGSISVEEDDGATDGISVYVGGYRTEEQEFTDPFDFPDGFYTSTVYVTDEENGTPCMELISSSFDKYGDRQIRIAKLSQLREFLLEIRKKNSTAIPVLSRDNNFELKGSVTDHTYLDVYEEIATGRRYMVLEIRYY